jgi:hypothetical protein
MGERQQRISSLDRQMLSAAYWPVIVFAAVLIGARISRRRRNELQAGQ